MTRFLAALIVLATLLAVLSTSEARLAGLAGLVVGIAGFGVVAWRWAARRSARRRLEGLRALPPAEFEGEVARWLRRDGWRVEQLGGTGDGGIDLLATRKKDTIAVQCKRYAEHAAVSAAQVRDLYGAAVALGATGALLVTTGRVSSSARAWAETLPEGPRLSFHDMDCVGELAGHRAHL
jgi:restriction system protein